MAGSGMEAFKRLTPYLRHIGTQTRNIVWLSVIEEDFIRGRDHYVAHYVRLTTLSFLLSVFSEPWGFVPFAALFKVLAYFALP